MQVTRKREAGPRSGIIPALPPRAVRESRQRIGWIEIPRTCGGLRRRDLGCRGERRGGAGRIARWRDFRRDGRIASWRDCRIDFRGACSGDCREACRGARGGNLGCAGRLGARNPRNGYGCRVFDVA